MTRSRKLWRLLLVVMAVGVGPCCAWGETYFRPNLNYRLIASSSMNVPGTEEPFTYLGYTTSGPPVLDAGNVAFLGGNSTTRGVCASIDGELVRIADYETSVPGRPNAQFNSFEKPGISGPRVVFKGGGFDAGKFFTGVYVWEGGEIRMVADNTTTIPESGMPFQSFLTPKVSGPNVAFMAQSENVRKFGVYVVSRGNIREVAATGDPLPDTTGTIYTILGIGLDGENVAFYATDTAGGEGIYAHLEGQLERIAHSTMRIPGSEETFRDGFRVVPSLEGHDVGFVADNVGVFGRLGNQMRAIADLQTTMPDTNALFTGVGGYVPVSLGHIAFTGTSAEGFGIYYGKGAHLTIVADSKTELDGKLPSSLHIGDTGLEEGELTFVARFPDQSFGLYVAEGIGRIGRAARRVGQQLHIAGAGGHQALWYDFTTGESSVSAYADGPGAVPAPLPGGTWTGLFLYDYETARFSTGVYRYAHAFREY